MSVVTDFNVASASRPIRLRMRPDLSIRKHRYQGTDYWVVKDPVGLNYYRFPREELFVLKALDGQSSSTEIQDRYEKEFAPQKLKISQLHDFLGTLHKSGLIQSFERKQGSKLLEKRHKDRRRELFSRYANVLAFRFRGVDPERLLNRLIRYTSWFFSKPMVMLVVIFGLTALSSVVMNWDAFSARLPRFEKLIDPISLMTLAIVLGGVKVLHEFGHGLSCKRLGGECHEMGLMFLVLTPCLYCNVSDSWLLPNKWHRAAIGAAGIYVEIFLASVATLIWWTTEPGVVNLIALQVMTVCSISTILFNGNPLLRFDGYYILSDLMEIPNLQQKSSQAFHQFLQKHFLGIQPQTSSLLPQRQRAYFILYVVASNLYKWFILISILFFLNRVFEPYGLKVIGQVIAVAAISTIIGMPTYRMIKFFSNPINRFNMKSKRLMITGTIAVAVLAGLLSIPFPHYIHCEFVVRPKSMSTSYVESPGELVELLAHPGEKIAAGQVIMRLQNVDIEIEHARIVGQCREKEMELKMLERSAVEDDPAAHRSLQIAKAEMGTLLLLLEQAEQKLQQLNIRATRAGTLIPYFDNDVRKRSRENPVDSIFDPQNRSAYLPIGFPVCHIGDPEKLEAVLLIDEHRVDLVREGLAVQLKTNSRTALTLESSIDQIGRRRNDQNSSQQEEQELRKKYFASAALSDSPATLSIGLQGRARIRSGNRSTGSRIARWIADTFRFEM